MLTDAVYELTNLAAKIPTAAQIAGNPVAHFNVAAGAAIWDAIERFDNAIYGKAIGESADAAPVTSNVKVDVFVDAELVASKIVERVQFRVAPARLVSRRGKLTCRRTRTTFEASI